MASLAGMPLTSTTRENLARSSVEALLRNLATGLDALRNLGIPIHHAILTGGGNSRTVRELAPRFLRTSTRTPGAGKESVAYGAAPHAAHALRD